MKKNLCSGLSEREAEECRQANEELDAEGQWINNEVFTKEMKILWRNLPVNKRNAFGEMIRDYFDSGGRSDKIINKLGIKQFLS